jgi:putative membrane protein
MDIELRPDKKLFIKQIYIFLTLALIVIIIGLILQLLIPLGKPTPSEVANILWPIIGGVILLFMIIGIPISYLWIKNLSYVIEDERVKIYKGIITKMQQNIPFRMVTDFMLHRSLYDRFLGIGRIMIQTAGQSHSASGYEGSVTGLTNWEEIYNELRERLREVKSDTKPASAEEVDKSQLSQSELLAKILDELKAIRTELRKDR